MISGSSSENQKENVSASPTPLVNRPMNAGQDTEQMGEGVSASDLPEGVNFITADIGETLVFTQEGQELYSVTVEKTEFTERRAVAETKAPEKVLLVTYSYISLSGEAVLVDDMSFRCLEHSGVHCVSYYLADQRIPEINSGGGTTQAEVAFSVPSDMQEAVLYITNNSNPDGETYQITVSPQDDR